MVNMCEDKDCDVSFRTACDWNCFIGCLVIYIEKILVAEKINLGLNWIIIIIQ